MLKLISHIARIGKAVAVLSLATFAAVAAAADLQAGKAAYAKKDYAAALRELSGSADSGSSEAHYLLGTMYEAGWGAAQNSEEAVRHYRLAAQGGSIEAQLKLSADYATGTGVRKDPAISAYWQWRAADGFAASEEKKLDGYLITFAKTHASSDKAGGESTPLYAIPDSCGKPTYPREASDLGQQGRVIFLFLVAPDGTTMEISTLHTSGSELLDKAARDAFTSCRFNPLVVDGVPRMSVRKMTYVFLID